MVSTLIYSAGAYRAQADRYQETLDAAKARRAAYAAEGNRKHVERIEPMIEHYTRLVQQYRDLAEQKEQQG